MIKKGIFLIVILTLITSCKSAKIADSNITNLSAKKIIKKHYKVGFDKESIRANLLVKYKGKADLPKLKASLRMVKDSIIWLSFTKIGFPIAKIMITPERVRFYEKISKTYFDGNFELISKSLGTDFDFQKIQNLFIGEALMNLKDKKYLVQIQQNLYELKPKKSNELFDIYFWINPYNFKLIKEEIQHSSNKNQRLTIKYDVFTEMNKSLFPTGFEIKAVDKKRKTVIDVKYKNVIFDTTMRFPFKIPKSYKKIELK